MADEKKPIDENVTRIANMLKKDAKDVSDGVVEFCDGKAFEKSLEGTDLDMDTIKKVHSHRDHFIAGATLALGQIGIDRFKKKGSPSQISSSIRVHKDEVSNVFYKERNLPDREGGVKPKKGVSSVSYKVSGGVATRKFLKEVKSHLTEEAAKNL